MDEFVAAYEVEHGVSLLDLNAVVATRIRHAQAEDIDAVAEIEREADRRFADSAHPELALGDTIPCEVLEAAVARGRLFVAVNDDEVTGWVLLTRSERELCVGQISVRPDRGRQGVGTALLTHVISLARHNGERSIVLNTQSDVPWNRPWYEKHGFEVVDQADWTPDMRVIVEEQTAAGLDWDTRVHMRLVLGS